MVQTFLNQNPVPGQKYSFCMSGRMFHKSYKGVSKMFQECSKEVAKGCFKSASKVLKRKFQMYYQQGSRMFHGRFKCFKGSSRMF